MKKEELSDVTFQILVRLDSIERMENTHATVNYLTDHFNASVNVWECSVRNNGYLQKLIGRKINYTFKEDHDPVLYRTKYLNQMIRSTQTPFVAIWGIPM